MSAVEETLSPNTSVHPRAHENDAWVYVQSGQVGAVVSEK